jgi:hypothetical protein
MSKRIALFSALFVVFSALTGCSDLLGGASSSGSVSANPSSGNVRPDVSTVLNKFANHNGTNVVTFNYLSASTDTSSMVAPKIPTLNALYVQAGFEFDFVSNWDAGRVNYGCVNLSLANSHSMAAGLYDYTLDSANKLVLGTQESGGIATDEAYQVFGQYTPQYLEERADYFANLFEPTSRTEYNSLDPATSTKGATQDDVNAVAKALNVYGILTGADSAITIHHVDLYYTATTSSYTFNFYIDYNGMYSVPSSGVSSVSSANYPLGARAKLSAFGTTGVPAISAYLI